MLSAVLFTQCYNQVGGDTYSSNDGNVIYVDALLKNDCNPELRFTSAVAAYSSSTPEMLNDEDIDVQMNNGEGLIPLTYEHDSQVFTNRDVFVSDDDFYTIEVTSKRDDIEGSISVSTIIPKKMNFSEMTIDEDLSFNQQGLKQVIYNVTLSFNHELEVGGYYYIEPISRLISNLDFVLTSTNEFDQYSINNVFTESNFVNLVDNNHGLLIDNMSGNSLNSISLNISLDNLLNVQSQAHNHIYFRLYHITEDYYMYLKSGGSFSNSNSSWFVEPVIQHSNVVGGKGIVGGASITLDSLAIN